MSFEAGTYLTNAAAELTVALRGYFEQFLIAGAYDPQSGAIYARTNPGPYSCNAVRQSIGRNSHSGWLFNPGRSNGGQLADFVWFKILD